MRYIVDHACLNHESRLAIYAHVLCPDITNVGLHICNCASPLLTASTCCQARQCSSNAPLNGSAVLRLPSKIAISTIMLTRPAFQASVLLLLISNIAASAPLVTRDTFTCVDDAECEARYVSDSWLIEKVVSQASYCSTPVASTPRSLEPSVQAGSASSLARV